MPRYASFNEYLAANQPETESVKTGTVFDLPEWVEKNIGQEFRQDWKDIADGRTIAMRCPFSPLEGQKDYPAWLTLFNDGAISGGCHHNSCADRGWTEIREVFEPLPELEATDILRINAAARDAWIEGPTSLIGWAMATTRLLPGEERGKLVAGLLSPACDVSWGVLREEDGDWNHVACAPFPWDVAYVMAERAGARGMAEWIVARERAVKSEDERTFVQTEEGKVVPSNYENVSLALDRLGVRLSYNEFADRYIVDGVEGIGPQLDDGATTRLHIMIQKAFGFLTPWPQFCKAVEDKCMMKRFHPVKAYLDRVQPLWDGVSRVNDWLSHYCGCENSAYTKAVGSIFLIAAVRRVRDPGCQFGKMLILEGKQGKGKSSLLRALCECADWFSDQVPLGSTAREMVEATLGKWIIEEAELAGMSRGEIGHLKANLTRQAERCRAAYARRTVDVSRQFVLVGSTNEDRYLEDLTGNIRFWPVLTHGALRVAEMASGRDMLWAEAAVREAAGESIELAEGLWDPAREQQVERETIDPWEEKLSEDLPAAGARVLSEDLYIFLGLDVLKDRDKRAGLRLGRIMRRLGWKYVNLKSNKVQRKCWAKGAAGKGSLVTLVADVRADGKVRSLVAAGGEAAF